MVDKIGNILAKDYGLDRPVEQKSFYVKGAEHCDWGMKDRLARIFDPKSGRTVMLAFDHGYIMGSTAGLERLGPGEALVTLREGKYHQIKRMMAARGKPVVFLKRLTFGPLVLDEALAPGRWRELTGAELEALRAAGGTE